LSGRLAHASRVLALLVHGRDPPRLAGPGWAPALRPNLQSGNKKLETGSPNFHFPVSIFQFPFSSFSPHSMPHNSRIPGPILRFDWRLLHSGNSSFLGSENANPCVFSRSLGSFPLFSIFFAFLATFSLRRADSEPPSPPRLQACSCDNSHRLPPLEPLVKSKMKDRIQDSGFKKTEGGRSAGQ